jgi:hypothetical protein
MIFQRIPSGIKFILCVFILSVCIGSRALADGVLTITPKNFTDNSPAAGLTFSTIYPTDTYKVPQQYFEVSYVSTRPVWQIDVYTDNSTADTGYQSGGLINQSTHTSRMPLGWKVFASTPSVPSTGDPSVPDNGWFWLKDKNDNDDPGTYGDESWSHAQKEQYTTFVYGGQTYSYLKDGPLAASPVYLCLEAIMDGVAGGATYYSMIWFDLYHVTDVQEPVIEHTPFEKIGMVGNTLKISATVTDDNIVANAVLYYRINSGSWQQKTMTLSGTLPYNKNCYAYIQTSQFSLPSTLEYYMQASDGILNKMYKSSSTPQTLQFSDTSSSSGFTQGTFTVEDGNPDDGSVSLTVPAGALSEPADIYATQLLESDPSLPAGSGLADSAKPLAAYDFGPAGLEFSKPATLTLLYFDTDGDGKPEYHNGTQSQYDESDLGLFRWDGFEWNLVSTDVNTSANTVTGFINHFSIYAVFPVAPLSEDDYRPKESIITPATQDGINDYATFNAMGTQFRIKIFDISGRRIKLIDENSASGPVWDGTDSEGNIVESGIYIYQFKANVRGKEKLISGTLIVAK